MYCTRQYVYDVLPLRIIASSISQLDFCSTADCVVFRLWFHLYAVCRMSMCVISIRWFIQSIFIFVCLPASAYLLLLQLCKFNCVRSEMFWAYTLKRTPYDDVVAKLQLKLCYGTGNKFSVIFGYLKYPASHSAFRLKTSNGLTSLSVLHAQIVCSSHLPSERSTPHNTESNRPKCMLIK